MKIAIVGWGLEGQSAYRFFGPDHEYLIVNEEPRENFPEQTDTVKIQFLAGKRQPGLTGNVEDLSYLEGLENCDKVIYTAPAAKNLERKFGKNPEFWAKATTIQHIFFETVKTKNVIGVTGSKGKGTTSTLIAGMLKAAGKNVFLGGNIGVPVLDFVRHVKPEDWVVLELSNFQLYSLTYSPHIAVCLMIIPEHMDWHPNMSDYTEAKANMFRHQKPEDIAVYFADNKYSVEVAGNSPGRKVPFYKKPGARVRSDGKIVIGDPETEIIDKSEVKLLGEHNLQNVCAAVTAVWFGLDEIEVPAKLRAMHQVLTNFSGLEHRLEFVRELDGVKYYDDSFGTTPDTAIVAMKAFSQPKVMILGGSDKGLPFDELARQVTKDNVRQAITIGKTGPKIAELLRTEGFASVIEGPDTMSGIVEAARQAAQPGDVVLLSTACASFGLFTDYKDRGNQFKSAVQALA
jgi:UDP-N-acetylmuramoylalanine--D-glutamate ligase